MVDYIVMFNQVQPVLGLSLPALRRLSVGITRAVDRLVWACDRASEFGQRLNVALETIG